MLGVIQLNSPSTANEAELYAKTVQSLRAQAAAFLSAQSTLLISYTCRYLCVGCPQPPCLASHFPLYRYLRYTRRLRARDVQLSAILSNEFDFLFFISALTKLISCIVFYY